MEKHGVGNWEKVARHIGTKTPTQIEKHYFTDYFGTFGSSLPSSIVSYDPNGKKRKNAKIVNEISTEEFVFGRASHLPPQPPLPKDEEMKQTQDLEGGMKKVERDRDGKGISTTSMTPSHFQDLSTEIAKLPGGTLTGYMPLREDFEFHSYHDLEEIVTPLSFEEDDTPEETAFKFQVLQGYNRFLDLRQKKEEFAVKRGLVDCKRNGGWDKRRSKEERELTTRLAPLAQFHSHQEHTWLTDSVSRLRRIKLQIAKLSHFRRMGLTTEREITAYEEEIADKERELTMSKKKSQFGSFKHQKRESLGEVDLSGNGHGRKKKKKKKGKNEVEEQQQHEGRRSSRSSSSSSSNLVSLPTFPTRKPRKSLSEKKINEAGGGGENGDDVIELIDVNGHEDPKMNNHISNHQKQKTKKLTFDITDMEGVDQLDEVEKELCIRCMIPPITYLAIKQELIIPSVEEKRKRYMEEEGETQELRDSMIKNKKKRKRTSDGPPPSSLIDLSTINWTTFGEENGSGNNDRIGINGEEEEEDEELGRQKKKKKKRGRKKKISFHEGKITRVFDYSVVQGGYLGGDSSFSGEPTPLKRLVNIMKKKEQAKMIMEEEEKEKLQATTTSSSSITSSNLLVKNQNSDKLNVTNNI